MCDFKCIIDSTKVQQEEGRIIIRKSWTKLGIVNALSKVVGEGSEKVRFVKAALPLKDLAMHQLQRGTDSNKKPVQRTS